MLDSIIYLIENYWIFLGLALLVGVVTGWYSAASE